MERVNVPFEDDEYSALLRLCEREVRPIANQVRVIVRDRLREIGLLELPQTDNAVLPQWDPISNKLSSCGSEPLQTAITFSFSRALTDKTAESGA